MQAMGIMIRLSTWITGRVQLPNLRESDITESKDKVSRQVERWRTKAAVEVRNVEASVEGWIDDFRAFDSFPSNKVKALL